MGFSTNLQGQASHEALLGRQEAEIKLLETMRRCLTMKVKSDREYASTICSLSAQGRKIERTEELIGSMISQVFLFFISSFRILINLNIYVQKLIYKMFILYKKSMQITRDMYH